MISPTGSGNFDIASTCLTMLSKPLVVKVNLSINAFEKPAFIASCMSNLFASNIFSLLLLRALLNEISKLFFSEGERRPTILDDFLTEFSNLVISADFIQFLCHDFLF